MCIDIGSMQFGAPLSAKCLLFTTTTKGMNLSSKRQAPTSLQPVSIDWISKKVGSVCSTCLRFHSVFHSITFRCFETFHLVFVLSRVQRFRHQLFCNEGLSLNVLEDRSRWPERPADLLRNSCLAYPDDDDRIQDNLFPVATASASAGCCCSS